MKKIKVVITGGGTGGHIYPGVALAEQIMKLNKSSKILFVGSSSLLEKKVFETLNYLHIPLFFISFRKSKSFLKFLFKISLSFIKALNVLKKFEPDFVISVGGYSSAPITVIAKIKKIPIILCEQNVIPGLTNRLLFPIANRIYTSFEKTKGLEKNKKTFFSGNPLRTYIISKKRKTFPNCNKFFNIFILGGSNGNSFINNVIINSIKYFKYSRHCCFIHQTGNIDEKWLKKKYLFFNINAEVKNFFSNIERYYKFASLIICSGGATTISEVISNGIPSIIIPNPYVAYNHQLFNAKLVTNYMASVFISQKKLDSKMLAKYMSYFFENPYFYYKTYKNTLKFFKNSVSEYIVNNIYNLLK